MSDFAEKIQLVVIGALCGVVPVIANSCVQARYQRHQMIVDRRIATLREYAESCAVSLQTGSKMVDAVTAWGKALKARESGPPFPAEKEAALKKEHDDVFVLVGASNVRAEAARIMVEALFRVDPTFRREPGPILDWGAAVHDVHDHCSATAKKLAAQISE